MAEQSGLIYYDGEKIDVLSSEGTNGQVLLSEGSLSEPNWVSCSAGIGLNISSDSSTLQYALQTPVSIANGGTNTTSMATSKGVVCYDGSSLSTVASTGTAGQILTSNGSSSLPTFQDNSIINQVNTWTPTILFGEASVGVTYALQTGNYCRIGNQVSFSCNITLTSKGTSVGNATITGLPFTAIGGNPWALNFSAANLTFALLGQPIAVIVGNTIYLQGFASAGAITAITNLLFFDTTVLQIAGNIII